jgi:hypothetical protein
MTGPALDGSFATPESRRRERRWQTAGLAILAGLVAAALVGQLGDDGQRAEARADGE